MSEEWRAVPNFRGYYEVSSKGRIRSLDRTVKYSNGYERVHAGQIITPGVDKDGYLYYHFSKNSKRKKWSIHRLVMHVFVGKCPKGKEVCHKNGKRNQNRLTNLRYDTPLGNQADRVKHGTKNFGSNHGNSKLVECNIIKIRKYDKAGLAPGAIAEKFNVSHYCIRDVLKGRTWSHIQ
jgi:hypothetical protein